ncbi:GLPGLI family protein [Maribacter sp. 2210JD10-5]|uniref:GLPGLI family protein n=1 Tax=Maribacter sp. 2210JD10-5 TaxID=3386272 RepID=UPI0039BD82C1
MKIISIPKCCFFAFSFVFLASAQKTIKVSYDFTDAYYNLEDVKTVQGTLIYSGDKSIYIDRLKEFVPGTTYFDDNDKFQGEKVDVDMPYFKDFTANHIICYSNVNYQKKAILKDSLKLFDWKLNNNDTKEILGFKCNTASSTFRGRKYTAYYTPELAVSDGPWKFNGLPGLILEVKEKDERIHYKAYDIKVINEKTEIKSPLKENRSSSWDEILRRATKLHRAKKEEVEQKYGGTTTTTFNGVEKYDLNE